MDFFTVPTAMFRVLYVFIVRHRDRRENVHFKVTAHPSTRSAAQQIVKAFPFDTPPRYLLRDRDRINGDAVQRRIERFAIGPVSTRRVRLGRIHLSNA
jgi:hypothetical protein